jgi:hypothetical protein
MSEVTEEQIDDLIALEKRAQRAAEQRFDIAMDSVYAEEEYEDQYESLELAGAFCGCTTCIVREILDAAWPHLYEMAHHPATLNPSERR